MQKLLSSRLSLAVAATAVASPAMGAATALQQTQQLSREEAIACASLGVLHVVLTDKGFKVSDGIDYDTRSKYWLQYAMDARPPEWEEGRVVEEFRAFHNKALGFMTGLLERYQKDRTQENLQAVVSAVQGLKQNLTKCDANFPG